MIHAASVRTFRFTLAELVARPRALRCRLNKPMGYAYDAIL